MAETVKSGDTVKLKSGGPTMTIGREGADGTWELFWFVSGGELKSAYFPPEALTPTSPN